MNNLFEASRQWASRPDDQRFLTMRSLREFVAGRTEHARAQVVDPATITPVVSGDDVQLLVGEQQLRLNDWSAQQLMSAAGVPYNFVRQLPPKLATANLLYAMRSMPRDEVSLYTDTAAGELRAFTSPSYGRILDLDVATRIEDLVDASHGSWQIPSATYAATNPKRATTLYASNRDIFIFLVDPTHPIEIPGQKAPSFRGFFAWNSEVGSSVFGLTSFLYEYVCDNRIVWGASGVRTVRIVHNSTGPDRYLSDAVPQLLEYMGQTDAVELQPIERAMQKRLISVAGELPEDQVAWVARKTKLTDGLVKRAFDATTTNEDALVETVWDAVQSLTAYARTIPYTDSRMKLETRAGSLLN